MATAKPIAKLFEEVNEDYLSCPICHEPYNKPKMLPCLHSYCCNCLDRHIQTQATNGVFRCPECQKDTKVTDEGADTFQDNFFLASLTEKLTPLSSKKLCHACMIDNEESEATSMCIDCDDYLCMVCAKTHHRSKLTRSHTVITIEELETGKYKEEIKAKEKVFCQEHKDEVLKYYCTKCQCPICRDCKTFEHDDHKCTPLENAVREASPQLRQFVTGIQSNLPIYTKLIEKVDQDCCDLDENEKSVQKEIDDVAKKYHGIINQHIQKLHHEVTEKAAEQRKQLENTKEKLQLTFGIIQSTADTVNNILDHGKDAEILLLQHQMTTRLKELQDDPILELPCKTKLRLQHKSNTLREITKENALGQLVSLKLESGPAKATKKEDHKVLCELCDSYVPSPVTYHMRQMHPGCGGNSKGRGFNSNGKYCGGWTGKCGDSQTGRITAWYLLCETCRNTYIWT